MKALAFEKYVRADRESFGTVAENIGKGGKLRFISDNFANPDKRVAVVLEKADGTSTMVTCSKVISEKLRSKQMSLGQLIGLEITQQTNEAGDLIPVITMPAGSGKTFEVSFDSLKPAEFKQEEKTFQPEELLAL